MNNLVGLSVEVLRTLKMREPGAFRFTFQVEMDKASFDSNEFANEIARALEKVEMQDMKGWAKCEEYFLSAWRNSEPIEIEGQNYFLVSQETMRKYANLSSTQETEPDINNNPSDGQNSSDQIPVSP